MRLHLGCLGVVVVERYRLAHQPVPDRETWLVLALLDSSPIARDIYIEPLLIQLWTAGLGQHLVASYDMPGIQWTWDTGPTHIQCCVVCLKCCFFKSFI